MSKGQNNKDSAVQSEQSDAFQRKVEKKMEEGYRYKQALAIVLGDDKEKKQK